MASAPERRIDPAFCRPALLTERLLAGRDVAVGVVLLASMVAFVFAAVMTNDLVLFFATFYVPFAMGLGALHLIRGVWTYTASSVKLRALQTRDTGLPKARLVG